MKTDLSILHDWIKDEFTWWSDGDETFYFYAGKLLDKGFSIGDIKTMLVALYQAVANEYGD